MTKRNIHIVPNKEQGMWDVKREGTDRPLSSHHTQTNADTAGRRIARQDEVELVIHRRNGTIRDKDSFGNDECPPKDTKH